MMLHQPLIIQEVRKVSRPLPSRMFLHRTVAEHWTPTYVANKATGFARTSSSWNLNISLIFLAATPTNNSLTPFIRSDQCRFLQGCPSLYDHFLGVEIITLLRLSAMTVLVKKEQQDNTVLSNAPGMLSCLLSSHIVEHNCGQLGWGSFP